MAVQAHFDIAPLASKETVALNSMQQDALMEVGNIGAGNAATALSRMLNRRIGIGISSLKVLPINMLSGFMDDYDQETIATQIRVSGDLLGDILLCWTRKNALLLTDMLTGRPAGTTKFLDEFDKSAVKEIGSILSISYLNAISSFLRFSVTPTVPSLLTGTLDWLIESRYREAIPQPESILLLRTTMLESQTAIEGHFILMPDQKSLNLILLSLWVPEM